jgi:DNA-directed RNA polymerase I subunit RPA1
LLPHPLVLTTSQNIVVEGSNLHVMAHVSESIVDVSRIKTNDIGAVLNSYGVEAARATILQEIRSVFAAYAINVNARHLMLIADYMVSQLLAIVDYQNQRSSQTFDGGYKPFNRKGIATHSSPLLKSSFETTATFISDATLHGDFDNLTTPSSNIVLGRPSLTGTGIFDLVMPLPTSK